MSSTSKSDELPTRNELKETLARYFEAMTEEHVDIVVESLTDLFLPENKWEKGALRSLAQSDYLGRGQAWKEEHYSNRLLPSPMDYALMIVAADDRRFERMFPRALPYCPQPLIGRWEMVERSHGTELEEPPPIWELGPAGKVSATGFADKAESWNLCRDNSPHRLSLLNERAYFNSCFLVKRVDDRELVLHGLDRQGDFRFQRLPPNAASLSGPATTSEKPQPWSPFTWKDGAFVEQASIVSMNFARQLQTARVPLDALDTCIACWWQALSGLSEGEVPAERLHKLDHDLASTANRFPALRRWMIALRRPVCTANDLGWLGQFLIETQNRLAANLWSSWLEGRPGPPPRIPKQTNFPIYSGIGDGAFLIIGHISGTPARGLYRAVKMADPSKRYLATMGSRQRRALDERARELSFAAGGAPALELVGRLDDKDEYHVLVEEEPAGVRTNQLPLPLPLETIVDLAAQVAKFLDAMHAMGSVVRYLRPELIYADLNDNAKLSGIAVRTEAFLSDVIPPCYGVLPLFETIYCAPEVVAAVDIVSPAADVFSLSAIVALWRFGEHPFAGETATAQIAALWQDPQPSFPEWSRVGPVLADGMHRDPAARPSLDELIRRLREAAMPLPDLDDEDDEDDESGPSDDSGIFGGVLSYIEARYREAITASIQAIGQVRGPFNGTYHEVSRTTFSFHPASADRPGKIEMQIPQRSAGATPLAGSTESIELHAKDVDGNSVAITGTLKIGPARDAHRHREASFEAIVPGGARISRHGLVEALLSNRRLQLIENSVTWE